MRRDVAGVRRRGWLCLLAGMLGMLALALVPVAPAAAHGNLVSTDPDEGEVLAETPEAARFTFNEPVSVPAGVVSMFDARGDSVQVDAATRDNVLTVKMPDSLADGTYVLVWRVVSADGHPVGGALSFAIGEPSPVVAPRPSSDAGSDPGVRRTLSAVQATGYVGLFLAAGLALFLAWVLPSEARLDSARHRLRKLTQAGAGVAVLAGLLQLPLSGAYQQGRRFTDLVSASGWTAPGGSELTALLALVSGLVAVWMLTGEAPLVGRRRYAVTVAALVALVSPAIVGHSRTVAPQVLVLSSDVLHVVSGAFWLGGLAGLAVTLPVIAGRARLAAETLARFSTLAAGVVAALVAAGVVLAWRIIGSWGDLIGTTYGQLLIVKVGVVGLAVAIAAWNRFRLLPRVSPAEGHTQRVGSITTIRRTISVEAMLLVGVLLLTGFLANHSPQGSESAPSAAGSDALTGPLGDDLEMSVTVSPQAIGKNDLIVKVRDTDGEPFDAPRNPRVGLRTDTVDVGYVEVIEVKPGTYRAKAILPTDGTWRVQVSIRLDTFENPVGVVSFPVEPVQ